MKVGVKPSAEEWSEAWHSEIDDLRQRVKLAATEQEHAEEVERLCDELDSLVDDIAEDYDD